MYQTILNFWFEELEPSQWWKKDEQLDEQISTRFAETYQQACCCELYSWRATAKGRLAEVIVLDQFSRNMYRNSPLCFAYDALALALAQEAVLIGADVELTPIQRSVLYLPYMHSESLKIHELALPLYQANGLQSNLDFEIKHKQIIEKFARYPHRNTVLGRESTEQELEFLSQPGSSF
ncbi:DUF924 family protein [Methyloprofundus sp.]|uniref:DUF924 family protein n=1 Tax=Methyloprofundus sp. TaxID=2020875 RepID=UPI003D12CFE2